MLLVPTGRAVVVYAAAPVASSVPVPSVVDPLRKVTVPVEMTPVPPGGVTTAVRVTLPPWATLAALLVSVVVVVKGAGGAIVVVVSAVAFAASALPAPCIAV